MSKLTADRMVIRITTQRFSHADNNFWKPSSITTETLFCLATDMHSLLGTLPVTAGRATTAALTSSTQSVFMLFSSMHCS
jgi:hypothetical protein